MPTNVRIENNLSDGLSLTTTVSPSLHHNDWGVTSDSPPAGQTTRVLWMDRDVGIPDKKGFVFSTAFEYAGVVIQLQERVTGTFFSSTIEIQIVAGDRSTGWQPANTTLAFTGAAGVSCRIRGTFVTGEVFDDVTYSIGQAILPQINHVVVLMMENRSQDNLLGWLYAAQNNQPPNNIPAQTPPAYDGLVVDTFGNQLTPTSPIVFASQGAQSTVVPSPDPGELFDQMTAQIFGSSPTANMSGFLANYATLNSADPTQIMQSYSPAQVPVISQIARSFAVSDAWFASLPCQTWPNRGFLHAGSSDGHINNDDYEPYDIATIFNLLEDQGVSWMVYSDGLAPSLAYVMFPQIYALVEHFKGMLEFYVLCQQPADAPASQKLPQYTFIEPNFLDPDESYHPPHDITPAEQFLATVYAAIQACPYRDEILFVFTFDEHGGCYDHVPPPANATPPLPGSISRDGTFDFTRFGVRVPAIVASSYVTPGTVFRIPSNPKSPATPYDHTTILATLRDWLSINAAAFQAALPSPRIAAAPTLDAVLSETEPLPWPVVKLPLAAKKAVNLNQAPDELVMSIVAGEASRREGKYIGKDRVAALRREIQTIQQARAYLAVRPRKQGK